MYLLVKQLSLFILPHLMLINYFKGAYFTSQTLETCENYINMYNNSHNGSILNSHTMIIKSYNKV